MFSDIEYFKTWNYYDYMTFLIVDVYKKYIIGGLGLGWYCFLEWNSEFWVKAMV